MTGSSESTAPESARRQAGPSDCAASTVPSWSTGQLLSDPFKKWAWKTLCTARVELAQVVDGVMDDLDGLSAAACGTAGGLGAKILLAATPEQLTCRSSPVGVEEGPVGVEEALRVCDLQAPVPLCGDYEPDAPENERDPDDDFEVINFEEEARIIVL